MRRGGYTGARLQVDGHLAAHLLAIVDAQITPHIAGRDVESVPELLEAVAEDETHRCVDRGHRGDGGEAIAFLVAGDEPERVGVTRQDTRLVRPHHQRPPYVRPSRGIHAPVLAEPAAG